MVSPGVNQLGLRHLIVVFFSALYNWISAEYALEVDDWLSNGQIPLYLPRQVKELGHDKFENLIHIYVVSCA